LPSWALVPFTPKHCKGRAKDVLIDIHAFSMTSPWHYATRDTKCHASSVDIEASVPLIKMGDFSMTITAQTS